MRYLNEVLSTRQLKLLEEFVFSMVESPPGNEGTVTVPHKSHRSHRELGYPESETGGRYVELGCEVSGDRDQRGIEIILPWDATKAEMEAGRYWAAETKKFFANHGVDAPLRHGDGVRQSGWSKRSTGMPATMGVIVAEPFYWDDLESRGAIKDNGPEYAGIVACTLGRLPGVTIVPPHGKAQEGCDGGSEREFIVQHILLHF